jgi:hypothetical protein
VDESKPAGAQSCLMMARTSLTGVYRRATWRDGQRSLQQLMTARSDNQDTFVVVVAVETSKCSQFT